VLRYGPLILGPELVPGSSSMPAAAHWTTNNPAVGAALRLKEICLVVVPRATTCTMQKVGHLCHWTGVRAASTAHHINYAEKERIWIDVTLIREGGRVRRSGSEGSLKHCHSPSVYPTYGEIVASKPCTTCSTPVTNQRWFTVWTFHGKVTRTKPFLCTRFMTICLPSNFWFNTRIS